VVRAIDIKKIRKSMPKDREGIEGLPLKILIGIIITVVVLGIIMVAALGIIIVWLENQDTPPTIKTISVDPPTIELSSDSEWKTINVTVYDNDNNRFEGVYIYLDGCNTTNTVYTTDSNGEVIITTLVELPPDVDQGEIVVKAQKDGSLDKEFKIEVYRKPPPTIKTISVDPETIGLSSDSETKTITVTVYDNDNNRLEGVHIYLDGCNTIKQVYTTDSNGEVSITTLIELPPGIDHGKIVVKAQKDRSPDKEFNMMVYRE